MAGHGGLRPLRAARSYRRAAQALTKTTRLASLKGALRLAAGKTTKPTSLGGGAIVRGTVARASNQATLHAAMREAKKALRLARAEQFVIVQSVRQAEQQQRQAVRPRTESGPLWDGKEIRSQGGQLVGHWRYRGGRFTPEIFPT